MIFGFYIYLENPKEPVNRSYFLFSVVLMVVSFSEFMIQSAFSPLGIVIWIQIHLMASMFIGPYFLYFALVFSRLIDTKKIYQAYFFIPSFMVGLILNSFGISGVIKQPWGYTYEISNLAVFETAAAYSWLSGLFGSAIVLYVYFTSKKSNEKKQAILIFMAALLPLFGTFVTVFIVPLFRYQFPMLVSIPFLFQFALMSYAISEYSLFIVDPKKAAQNIVDVMSESLVTTDLTGAIASVNRATCELLNHDETDLISRSVTDFFYQKPEFISLLDRLRNGERVIKNIETELLTKAGRPVPVLLSLSVLPDKRDELAGFLVLARDITSIRDAEKALRKSKNELKTKVKERTTDLNASNLSLKEEIGERKKAEAALRQKEHGIRRAYATVFSAVTGDKLIFMTKEEIEASLGARVGESMRVTSFEELAQMRSNLRSIMQKYFPHLRESEMLVIAACEAVTNSVKHADGGQVQVSVKGRIAQVAVTDFGPGIDFSILPKATLIAGYSTRQSLGMGFSLMLEVCERVLLATQPGFTSIVLEVS